ncbi:MAG: GHKL domain-containing protein [Vampirovibrio sp.]|nr:GHKL domain-containing protein [Vampirovibrio sp.]
MTIIAADAFLLPSIDSPWLQAIEALGHGILIADAHLQVRWVNTKLAEQLSISKAEVEKKLPLSALFNDIEVKDLSADLTTSANSCLATKTTQRLIVNLAPADKPRSYFDVLLLCFQPSEDIAPVLLMVLEDRTKIILTEKMRRDFVANVSHELRTPLSVLKGYTETLLSGALKDYDLAVDFITTIEQHANRLTRLVEDLLDLSKFEADNFILPLEVISLEPLLLRVQGLAQAKASLKNITVVTQPLPKKLPKIMGHVSSLEQVFLNLVDNAIKYSPADTTISISFQPSDAHVVVAIADEGIGIEAKFVPRLFERFFRVDKTRSKHLGGTGLGLSIVKHTVQAHHGDIWVESTPGVGSTFMVKLHRVLA